MANDFTVVAESRADVGKGASRRLRHTGKIPGVLYGAGKDAMSITMGHDHVMHHLEHEAFYSHILSLELDGSTEKVVLKDVQRHPSQARILHLDFLRISETAKIHMHVPIHFVGEEEAPGCKEGGKVQHLMTGVDIACLAKDLPEFLEVDLSNVALGDSLHLSDIKVSAGVEIPALAQGDDHDLPIVSIHKPKKAVEVEDTPAAAADEGAAEEGGGDA
ncbi:MAG: 50S ribosomal protein L25/general stress protein Ctc [Thiohalomonadales bacterium]